MCGVEQNVWLRRVEMIIFYLDFKFFFFLIYTLFQWKFFWPLWIYEYGVFVFMRLFGLNYHKTKKTKRKFQKICPKTQAGKHHNLLLLIFIHSLTLSIPVFSNGWNGHLMIMMMMMIKIAHNIGQLKIYPKRTHAEIQNRYI